MRVRYPIFPLAFLAASTALAETAPPPIAVETPHVPARLLASRLQAQATRQGRTGQEEARSDRHWQLRIIWGWT